MATINSVELLKDQATADYGDVHSPIWDEKRTFQAFGTTTAGAGSATIKIWASNVAKPAKGTDVDWVLLGTITLTLGTTQTTDGFATDAPWRHVKAEVDAISGTGAKVTVLMGA